MFVSRKRMLEILEQAQDGDRTSRFVDRFLSFLIVTNILAVSLESVESIGIAYRQAFLIFEYFSVVIFGIEYLLRIWSSADRISGVAQSATGRRLAYIFSFNGLVDLIAILPSLLALVAGNVDLRWVRVVRLLRILKISNYSSALEDLASAIYEERRSFLAALYLFCIALFIASALMYVVERHAQPDQFASIPEAMWWALITLTTVGYGDVSPVTPLGKIVGALTAFMGVCTVALLTGIIANAFASQVSRKKDILMAEVSHALQDGEISEDEYQKIEHLRRELNLPEAQVRAIVEIMYKDR
ncbi:MAG: ion transporter [Parvibaculales bacterium]